MFLEKLRRFMYGRYGTDELNLVLMILGIIVMFLSRIFWFWGMKLRGHVGVYLTNARL